MAIKVFKFGGASVKDASHIYNVKSILESYNEDKIVLVVSAMGKTTNALETVYRAYVEEGVERMKLLMRDIIDFHLDQANQLNVKDSDVESLFNNALKDGLQKLEQAKEIGKEAIYDQIVSLGELFSSILLNSYLKQHKLCAFVDIRQVLKTNDRFQEGEVNFDMTSSNLNQVVSETFEESDIIVTQGFIGQASNGLTTTLGREGSDYTAAIIAFCLNVTEMTVWKDVPGVLTADPRRFENVEKIDRMSYKEAIEMTYYGAQVIHPKTISPLQNKNIKLNVKSYINPDDDGTVIAADGLLNYPPLVVIQDDMILLHISSKDFSFIAEDHLSQIFLTLNKNRLKLATMRNSAISFSICVKNPGQENLDQFISDLGRNFTMDVYKNLQLITVRYFNKQLIQNLTKNKVVLFEERMKYTIQLVVRPSLELIEKKL